MALRWLVQQDLVVLPRSVNPERIAANAELFDFELDPGQMSAIAGIRDGADHADPDRVDF